MSIQRAYNNNDISYDIPQGAYNNDNVAYNIPKGT